MFTGIITDVGTVKRIAPGTDTRIEIETGFDTGDLDVGASVACSGPCLTVIEKGRGAGGNWFAVEASAETLRRTTLGGWESGRRVNLERATRLGDELGGHLVNGHIDGVASVREKRPAGDTGGSVRFVIEAPAGLARFIAEKGSLALDGVSLTVNSIDGAVFAVNVIPHTLEHTTLGEAAEGTRLNLEVDIIARYVARLTTG